MARRKRTAQPSIAEYDRQRADNLIRSLDGADRVLLEALARGLPAWRIPYVCEHLRAALLSRGKFIITEAYKIAVRTEGNDFTLTCNLKLKLFRGEREGKEARGRFRFTASGNTYRGEIRTDED
jgi:hypothetical protein